MTTLQASAAQFLLEGEHLEWDDLMVVDFVGREAISQPFRFDLRLMSKNPSFAFEDVLNKPVALTVMRDDGEEKFHGVIVDFSQGGFADRSHVFYHAVLVPRFWLLGLNYQSRVFNNQSVEDIVTDVLEKSGFASDDVRWALKKTPPAREYVVQYRETDLAFVSRLLEHEGIAYFFDQSGDKEVVVFTDDPAEFPALEAPEEVPYRGASGQAGKVPEHVNAIVLRERIVTSKVMLRDYNYRTPELNLQAESQLNRDGLGIFYEYGDHFKNVEEGNQLARVRNEEIECMRLVGRGRSDVRSFRAGHKFTLSEHFRDDWNQEYLILEVEHRGSHAEALQVGGSSGTPNYRNDFTCIPASAPYRPPRITPAPRLPGILTAKIESTGGPYAHLDDQGRYRVRLPFDLSDAGKAAASKAVRMTAPYGGPGYGFHAPCHADVEMVLACIDGNIDRPLALGVAPNPSQMTPSTSRNKAQAVFRSASGNEMRMDDTNGSMDFFLNASKDMNTVVANDQSLEVGANRTVKVSANQDESVGGNMSLAVDGNLTESVKGNKDVSVTGNDTETVSGSKSLTVAANLSETIGANASTSIGASKKLTVGGALAVSSSALTLSCAAMTMSTGGALKMTINGASKETIAGSKTTMAAGSCKLTAASVKVTAGSITEQCAGEFKVKGAKVTIEAGMIELKAGGSSVSIGPSGVSIQTGAIVQINGSLVKIN